MATTPHPLDLPPTAQEPSVHLTLTAPVLKPAGAQALGLMLDARFNQYESDRKLAELKWARNARQYLGIYDPEVETKMDINRSRAYPKITRVKCVSMLSRLMNLLFPAGDKNWGITPSAVPDLSEEDLQTVLDTLAPPPPASAGMVAPGAAPAPLPPPPTDDQIEQAIREFAGKRARKLELEVQDQLQELGGARSCDYVALCRQVIASGIQYGAGIMKGPFVEEQKQRRWDRDATGRMVATTYTAMRPRFQFVPIWDYYPDMGAKLRSQMDGQFERIVMSKHQVIQLKERSDFIPGQIDKFLQQTPTGNYRRRAFETELRAMGVQLNTGSSEQNKYEAHVWTGFVSGRELADAGLTVTDDQLTQDVRAQVWTMGNIVVKAMLDPWSSLVDGGEMPMYHFFIFEEDETFLLGNALPNIMRDSQMGVCAATRMTMDNGSIMRVFELNTQLLRADQDISSIQPDKIFYREDDASTAQYPALRAIELPMQLQELQGIVKMFQEFADQETFVGAATGGDMQRGPSEPFRTAAGASMIRGDAALPFKDVVRNFDVFTESVINAMIVFNQQFAINPELKGDFKPVARGATSLIAKEVLGAQIDSFVQTLRPEAMKYIKMRALIRAQARIRDLDVDDIVMDDAGCDAVDAAEQQQQQAAQQQQQRQIEAQIREILSETLKNVSQAGKNTANEQATETNTVIDALERGVNPNALAANDNAGGAAADTSAAPQAGAGDAAPVPAPAAAPGQTGLAAAAMPAS